MDIKKNLKIFKKHIKNNFNLKDYNLKRKYIHSQMVAKIMYNLSKSIFKNDKENQKLCYTIGLLHDFARFYQWEKYKTYKDLKSIDHGDYAIDLLFKNNMIEKFDIPKQYYKIIRPAIKYHNKFIIPTKYKNGVYCKLIIDADKISNIILQSKAKTPLFSNQNGFTKEIINSYKNKKKMNYKYLNTKGDTLLAYLSSIYLLNFDVSKKYIEKKDYKKKMINAYKNQLLEEDLKVILELNKDEK